MTTYLLNQELNGVEIYFKGKPVTEILQELKENGFRWHKIKKCWYAKQNNKTIAIAEKMTNNNITETTPEQAKTKTKKIISLWDLTRWEDSNNLNKNLSTKEIAAEVRKHVRQRFPMCKFSVTSDYSSIRFYITASPFEKDSIYLKAIEEYCTNLLKAYNYCTCYDPYGDYGSSYNFYGAYARIDYDYKQTEQNENIKEIIQDFDNKKAEFEKAEEIRKEIEYQERQKQRELEEIAYQARLKEEEKEKESIYNNVNIINLEENKQYFVIGSQFAHLNKNNTLAQYKEEVEKEEYSLEDVKITRELHFTDTKALDYFSNLLLHDFDFLQGTGGSYTDDNRINSMTDYNNMTKEERQTVKFNLLGVAVYLNNKLQFVIDTQGYSYARYVGLVDNVTIQNNYTWDQILSNEEVEELKVKVDTITDISTSIIIDNNLIKTYNNEGWKLYKELMKQKLKDYNIRLSKAIVQQIPEDMEEFKISMYKLLTEVDGIQEQFKEADLQQGQKITIIKLSALGGVSTSHITVDSVEYTTYAQYNNAVKLIFKQEGKRGLYYNHYYDEILIYNDWIEVPKTLLYNIKHENGFTITQSKYGSFDNKQYDDILEYFAEHDIKPIINTYKPVF